MTQSEDINIGKSNMLSVPKRKKEEAPKKKKKTYLKGTT